MKILAIESSCDETAAAVVEDGRKVLSSAVNSQVEEHRKYGGVVPEIASRRHTENIVGIVDEALREAGCNLEDVDAVAVTAAPGLIGALLVGVNYAKGLALAAGKPLIPVHHIRGHIAANYLAHPDLKPPFLCLVASGGHSHIIEVKSYTEFSVIGKTRDDAAGEAFDKAARAMGYPYPGGVFVDKAAQKGDPAKYPLPHPKVEGSPYDFSFSGLKTAVINLIHNAAQKGQEVDTDSLCASFQKTVAEILTGRLMLAADTYGYRTIVVAGGVSANSGLRSMLENACQEQGYQLYMPPLNLCGDNAAMIGSQAYYEYLDGQIAGLSLNGTASMPIDQPLV
ncbi:tRNA (adenosine(37)-N6)-threonylcarbamoyltransferase complex transferase subunit TsaD [Merdimmobilis hominis]|uniref:tRNA N6-adenosine threonylcarbamoyltransferase n=1 Tax=uncultured Anaerotruncus sp. TaxID=905011 RepID=A0A6N2UZ84_9FIRM|nr:tRNA (adenosine(37)-N6)-threonylcarbamoyltransferase complex transferase subunit TsaD [Merdimmobilis hominis]MCD4836958.1 tRNA (adenosine(37)-N6)-threonylcarbamoyltransferase complex transferase subunit TsaD [Merdimmobilis hominis]PWL61113.1 MAG: tRNA (adenosine(37)-N6)-threonylcarbamoyltransferase complex transferase subunit TsaD [Oscillospiraceae bacterium]